jgi:nucleoside-diphosphate-sugar epimerase
MESAAARNEDFNISTDRSTTVKELATIIWRKVHGSERPLTLVSDPPFEYDVARRVPDVSKACRVLGFKATTPLEQVLDEVIPWVRAEVAAGRI